MDEVTDLLAEANEKIMNADKKERRQEVLETYERVLEIILCITFHQETVIKWGFYQIGN